MERGTNDGRRRQSRGRRAALIGAVALGALGATAASASAKAVYVSVHGKDTNPCTAKQPCRTIDQALTEAKQGYDVRVRGGVYHEQVKITKRIHLVGLDNAAIDARGLTNGILITGRGAEGAKVSGFTVEHANFEGILVQRTSHVSLSANKVRDNDLGAKAQKPVGECAAVGQIPGDCGEGIHLLSVTQSELVGNEVTGNSGGILLTDELGPTAHNTISHNKVLRNLFDCGITIAGHSTKAVSASGERQPTQGGVYSNTISHNVSNGNGTKGEGAGILIAAAAPGAGAYDNTVENNEAVNDSLAGVTIHSHTAQQDVNGNRIILNYVRNDGAEGDSEFGEHGTVGILVGSDVTKLSGIVIRRNKISNVHTGIYTKNAGSVDLLGNEMRGVVVPVTQV